MSLDLKQMLPHGIFLATRQVVQQSVLRVVSSEFACARSGNRLIL